MDSTILSRGFRGQKAESNVVRMRAQLCSSSHTGIDVSAISTICDLSARRAGLVKRTKYYSRQIDAGIDEWKYLKYF